MMEETRAKKKGETIRILNDIIKSKAVYVLSFIVPLIIMLAIYIMRDIFPGGDNYYLRSDMYHQYAPFFSQLWEKIRTGESLAYSWDIGMGTNFLALFGYYLSSPVNWFVALFPQKWIVEVMDMIIVLKIALASFTFTYYLCKHNNKRHLSAAIFGMFYALSGFVTAYSWNLMWLDSVLLFPLIILGIEKLVNEGKGLLYSISLGMAILSNYYIAIMICISSVIYFVITMVSRPVPSDKKDYFKSIIRFGVYSLLAGCFAAIILLPEMAALEYTASGSFNFPKTLKRYFSFFTVFKRHLINTEVHLGLDHLPNIYCGVAVFVLIPLYLMSKKITKREKIVKIIAVFIFITAFNMNIPNFVWHGLHYPNSLPCRQSFIYVFLILTLCYDAVKNLHEFKDKELSVSLWGALFFIMYLGNTLGEKDDFKQLYTSALFIGIYVLFLFFIKKWKKYTAAFLIAVFAISIVEVTINTDKTGYNPTSKPAYLIDYDAVETILDDLEAKDDSFFRITKYRGYRSKNDAAWHNFHGTSTFSSTAYAGMTEFFGHLGLEHSTNAFASNGGTPFINSLFSVKYLLTNKHIPQNDVYTYHSGYDGEFFYLNNYVLPLGFMTPADMNSLIGYENTTNPFQVQNNFISACTGIYDVFEPINFELQEKDIILNVEKDMFVYAYIQNKAVEGIMVYGGHDSPEGFTGVNHGRMIDIGYVNAGATLKISDRDDKDRSLNALVYTMNVDKYKEAMSIMASKGLEITEHGETYIKGNITADNDGYMFTSIPYDESWTVYVDGVKTDFESVGNAFITIPLSKGTHTIEMEYVPRRFHAGLALSIIAWLLIAGMIVFRVVFKKEITENGAIKLMITTIQNKKLSKQTTNEETENTISETPESEDNEE